MATPNVIFHMEYSLTEKELSSRRMSESKRKKLIRKRSFYSSSQKHDFIEYVDTGLAEGDFLGYSGNSEKSSGVFNSQGLISKTEKKILREKLRTTGSVIWQPIISFEEEFGEKHMRTYEDAAELLKSELPNFFRSIGIDVENVEWFAGLHENTDNRHIHLCFFEKEPLFYSQRDKTKKRYRYGRINEAALEKFKVRTEERLTNVGFEVRQSRKLLIDTYGEELKASSGNNSFEKELRKRLLKLYREMPTEGRISYNSLNMASLRPHIKSIVNFVIKSNTETKKQFEKFCGEVAERDRAILQICKSQKITEPKKYLLEEKYIEDIYRRLGEKVIQQTLVIKKKEVYEQKKSKSELAKKRIGKSNRSYLFERSMRICQEVNDHALETLNEFRFRLAKAEYERLLSEGVIEAE